MCICVCGGGGGGEQVASYCYHYILYWQEVLFGSRTHFHTEREILYSGILHEVNSFGHVTTMW